MKARSTAVGAVAAASAAAALAATPAAARLARRVGMLDRPGPLKPQGRGVPYLGGLGVAAGLAAGVICGRPKVGPALALALALGTADDRYPLPPAARLVGQAAVGAAMAGAVPTGLPAGWGQAAEVAATVLLMNGVNLVDGLDALAGGVTLAASAGFVAVLAGGDRALAASLAGATAGFLWHNRPPARVYLGDGGAYLLGACLSALLAAAWSPGHPPATGPAAFLLVAVPAAEVATAVARRRGAGAGVLAGDRAHPYDRLVDGGRSVAAVVGLYAGVQGALAALAARTARTGPVRAAAVVAGVATAGLVGLRAAGVLTPAPEPAS